jgi:uncharacterized protein (DUF983 family)
MSRLRLFLHALRLRCPECGGGSLFSGWFVMRPRCPACGLRTERGEQGYIVGAYMFNIVAAELLWAAVFLATLAATWPDPPWDLLLWGGGLLMLALPFLLYPFSKTVFLAFDLLFRPVADTEGDQP